MRTRPKILLTAAALLLVQEGRALAYWDCSGNWEAWTTRREMRGSTKFECWPGQCGNLAHSPNNTWVDILGGISQSCQDHSDTFFGPISGEWDGCKSSGSTQASDGQKRIAGINQWWDRWPAGTYNGTYAASTLNGYIGATFFMRDPYASVYDLDTCSIIQDVGTIFWGNFPIQSQLIAGHPLDTAGGYVAFEFSGSAGLHCSWLQDNCQTIVCADLSVRKRFDCTWVNPRDLLCGNHVCDSDENCNNCFRDCLQSCPP